MDAKPGFRCCQFGLRTLSLALVLIPCAACSPIASPTHSVAAPAGKESPPIEVTARWGANCNDALLAGPFSLDHATDFKVSARQLERINEVIEEVRGGYGGTLVTAPPDVVLDSPAFLAHYLRAFANPKTSSSYDYRFERILSRLSGAEHVLEDARLDWDVWRAFLLYENFAAGKANADEYTTTEGDSTFLHGLDGPKDLLWGYLEHNAQSIRKDDVRLRWWIDCLTQGMRATGGRPMRRWYLLQLAASTDTKTAALVEDDKDEPDGFPTLTPSPFHPFIILEGSGLFADKGPAQPPFQEAIKKIAAAQKLSYVIWDIDPASMPPTKAVKTDLALRLSQFSPGIILSQESWSKAPHDFQVGFSRPIGRRSSHYNVRLPQRDSQDGVFFFTFDATLYVWPKAQMDDAAVQMLHIAQLIDDKRYSAFVAQGYKRLTATAKSGP